MIANPESFDELMNNILNENIDEIILDPRFSYKKLDDTTDATYNGDEFVEIELKRMLTIRSDSIPVIIDFNDMKHSWMTLTDIIDPSDSGYVDTSSGCGILTLENLTLKNMKGIIVDSTYAELKCTNVKFDSCQYDLQKALECNDIKNAAAVATVNYGDVEFDRCNFINCTANNITADDPNPEIPPGLVVITDTTEVVLNNNIYPSYDGIKIGDILTFYLTLSLTGIEKEENISLDLITPNHFTITEAEPGFDISTKKWHVNEISDGEEKKIKILGKLEEGAADENDFCLETNPSVLNNKGVEYSCCSATLFKESIWILKPRTDGTITIRNQWASPILVDGVEVAAFPTDYTIPVIKDQIIEIDESKPNETFRQPHMHNPMEGPGFVRSSNVDIDVIQMPSMDKFTIDEAGTKAPESFFDDFNKDGCIATLPEGSFNMLKLVETGNNFCSGFNKNGKLITLPKGSFDFRNITTITGGITGFCNQFNNGGQLVALPKNSFVIDNLVNYTPGTPVDGFFSQFNSDGKIRSLPKGSMNTENITFNPPSFFNIFNVRGALRSTPAADKVWITNKTTAPLTFHYIDENNAQKSTSVAVGEAFGYNEMVPDLIINNPADRNDYMNIDYLAIDFESNDELRIRIWKDLPDPEPTPMPVPESDDIYYPFISYPKVVSVSKQYEGTYTILFTINGVDKYKMQIEINTDNTGWWWWPGMGFM